MEIAITSRQRDYALMGGIYVIACMVIFLVVRFSGMPSSVCDGYFPYADAMANGIFPYTEDVWAYGKWSTWEYPPLAYLFILIPRLFSSGVAGYQAAYIVLTAVFYFIGLWSAEQVSKYVKHDRLHIMALYTVLMLLMVEFLPDRYDVFPVTMTMAAVVLFFQKRYTLTFTILALATLAKLYPAVLIPILCIYLASKGEKRAALTNFCVYVGSCLLILAAFFAAGSDPLSFLNYHTDRPIEMEATFASAVEVLYTMGLTGMDVVFSYGSDNIIGPVPDAIKGYILPLMAAILILLYVHYAYWTRRNGTDRPEFVENSALVILISVMTFVLVSTVFSGQYMLWLIPLVLIYYFVSPNKEEKKLVLKLFILAEVFTQLDFLVNYGLRGEGEMISAPGIIVLCVRNALMVGIYFILTRRLIVNDHKKGRTGEGTDIVVSIRGLWNRMFHGRHGEAVRYLFIGGLNVLITWGLYAGLVLLGLNPSVSNAFSWVAGVFTAFVLNKIFVFESRSREVRKVGTEATFFLLGRVLTGMINIGGFVLLYNIGLDQELFGVDGFAAKIIISAIEIGLNYFFSKYLVFVQKD